MGAVKKQKPHSRASIVGKVIRGAMLRKDIASQTELGELMGVSKATISNRFSGNPFWDLPEIWKLDAILHFTDEEFLTIAKCARR